MFQLLADCVVALHLAFVVFAVAGALLALRWPRAVWLHLPAALWAAAVELAGWPCPLTPLENALRAAAGSATYGGSFLEHTVLPVLYPANLTRAVQLALGAAVLVANAGLYALVWWRLRRTCPERSTTRAARCSRRPS
jgi:hypothetical protein